MSAPTWKNRWELSYLASSPEFCRLVAGRKDVDLARVALEIGCDIDEELEPEFYLDEIAVLTRTIEKTGLTVGDSRQNILQINRVLFDQAQFQGAKDDYYSPENSYLHRVIERRAGIPVTLSLIYRAVGEGLGLNLNGVNLPGHFVVRLEEGADSLLIDPFHGGRILDRPACDALVSAVTGKSVQLSDDDLRTCSPQTWMLRLLGNLKNIYQANEDYRRLIPTLKRIITLAPEEASLWRDLGMALLEDGQPREAVSLFEDYLQDSPEAGDVVAVGALLGEARRRLRTMH